MAPRNACPIRIGATGYHRRYLERSTNLVLSHDPPESASGLAERTVAFRAANGTFESVDELLDVAGITDHRLDAILPYVVAR